MSVTEEIKSRLDIVDYIGENLQLRRSGRNYAAFCPFHSNTRTPAFYVFPETQTWRCFGACAEGGDIFSYVMKRQGWDFKEALKHLAQRAGVELEPQTPAVKQRQAAEEKQVGLLTAAADYFHQLLLHAPQAEAARAYLAKRALNEESIATFKLGFALNSWDACRNHFSEQGYSDEELLAVGLLTENPDKGTRYDRFRGRLIFPIRDGNGRIVGFGARTLDPDGIPKYLNSPQTDLFDKSAILYGLDLAKRAIRQERQVVIVEGYMDVIQAWQHGFHNVVAQMGTALTEPQMQQLKRYSKRFVMALDADAAGAKATLRSLDVARETLDQEVEIRFDARGLVQHEGRLKADIRVVTMPPGEDPDSIIRDDPDRWPALLEQAKPVVAYVIDTAVSELDFNDPKAKTALAQQVIPLIKEIADPVERDHYWQYLARALRIEERTLRQVQVAAKKPGRPLPPPPLQTAVPDPYLSYPKESQFPKQAIKRPNQHLREANFLSQCLRYPRALMIVNEHLLEQAQPPVSEQDFPLTEDRMILHELYQRVSAGSVAPISELWDSLEKSLVDRIQSLLTLPDILDEEQERLPDKLVLSVLDWRLAKAKQQLTEMKQLMREAEELADDEFVALSQQQLRELPLVIRRLNKAKGAMSAVSRRQAEEGNGRY
jgi:DNA primase